jgi:hypothetical protein
MELMYERMEVKWISPAQVGTYYGVNVNTIQTFRFHVRAQFRDQLFNHRLLTEFAKLWTE